MILGPCILRALDNRVNLNLFALFNLPLVLHQSLYHFALSVLFFLLVLLVALFRWRLGLPSPSLCRQPIEGGLSAASMILLIKLRAFEARFRDFASGF